MLISCYASAPSKSLKHIHSQPSDKFIHHGGGAFRLRIRGSEVRFRWNQELDQQTWLNKRCLRRRHSWPKNKRLLTQQIQQQSELPELERARARRRDTTAFDTRGIRKLWTLLRKNGRMAKLRIQVQVMVHGLSADPEGEQVVDWAQRQGDKPIDQASIDPVVV